MNPNSISVVVDGKKPTSRATAFHSSSVTFTLKDFAAFMGCNLESARRLLVSGKVPAIKIGTTWRVLRDDAMTYLTEEAKRQSADRRKSFGGEL
jgi:excisionase family DNA binding protein